jgi:hypothetical protein
MHQTTKLMTVALLCGMLTLCAAAGCAGRTTKTAQTITTEESAPAVDADETQPSPPVQRAVTTTTSESDNSSPGIVGSAFLLVWAVVSFPFRVIGALV